MRVKNPPLEPSGTVQDGSEPSYRLHRKGGRFPGRFVLKAPETPQDTDVGMIPRRQKSSRQHVQDSPGETATEWGSGVLVVFRRVPHDPRCGLAAGLSRGARGARDPRTAGAERNAVCGSAGRRREGVSNHGVTRRFRTGAGERGGYRGEGARSGVSVWGQWTGDGTGSRA